MWGDSIMASMNDYIQQETITGVVPMTNGDRQYSFWDLFLSTSGFAIGVIRKELMLRSIFLLIKCSLIFLVLILFGSL